LVLGDVEGRLKLLGNGVSVVVTAPAQTEAATSTPDVLTLHVVEEATFPTASAVPELFWPVAMALKVSIVSPESDGGPSTPGGEIKKATEFPEACTDADGAVSNVRAESDTKRPIAIRRR
jgi:hypothetical protein